MWEYDEWRSGEPYQWEPAARGTSPFDNVDFHVDLGCGRLKKGRIGVDLMPAPGVNVIADLDGLRTFARAPGPGADAAWLADGVWHYATGHVTRDGPRSVEYPAGTPRRHNGGPPLYYRLPFNDNSIESIVSHHALEHIGDGFLALVDEIYRVLKPGAIFRAITPLFPSRTAVEDPDHRRYFMEGTWESFCGTPGDTPQNCWLASFSVPYTKARFEMVDKDVTPPVPVHEQWGPSDARELRVALKAIK